MRRLGLGLTLDQIEQVLKLVDTDGDGEIEYSEFVQFLHCPPPPPPTDPADEAAARLIRPKEDGRSPWAWERPWQASMRSPWPLNTSFMHDSDGAVRLVLRGSRFAGAACMVDSNGGGRCTGCWVRAVGRGGG